MQVLVEALREMGGKPAVEQCCDLSSLPPEAKRIGQRIRVHRGIENSLHWVLDRVFDEDRSRVRAGHAAETIALRRRFALNLFRHDPSNPLPSVSKTNASRPPTATPSVNSSSTSLPFYLNLSHKSE
jgi:hypothetical protein